MDSDKGESLFWRRCFNSIIFPILFVIFFLFNNRMIEASWLIDPAKFHISAHGQFSCIDCHDDISKRELHPDPVDVNKKRVDFFDPETCMVCHDEVVDNLDQGLHGQKTGEDPDRYENCIQCHEVHTQPRLGKNSIGEFSPDKPYHEQCTACHEMASSLPDLTSEDRACMSCHGSISPDDPEDVEKIHKLCFHCHGKEDTETQMITGRMVPLISEKEYLSTVHKELSCTICHPEAVQFGHADQKIGDCRRCHVFHDEKVTSDAHIRVNCQACHIDGIIPVLAPESKLILWEKETKLEDTLRIHHMVNTDDEVSCRRCHFKGNEIGASSMILPAKSIICMPCHTGSFSIGDTITIISLLIFLGGMVMIISCLLSGRRWGRETDGDKFISKLFRIPFRLAKSLFSRNLRPFFKTMFLDVLLQRRLFRQSRVRWFIHGLIFFPFIIRFSWGILALLGSLFVADVQWIRTMLDKNDPITGFLFDLTGLILMIGIISALLRGILCRNDQHPALPEQDRPALLIIGGIIVVGFILEGMRVAMTGWPEGAEYGFVGYAVSLLFRGYSGLTELYGYVWYAHAVMAGIFIAYLPFSRLIHIIFAPIVLGVNAVLDKEHY